MASRARRVSGKEAIERWRDGQVGWAGGVNSADVGVKKGRGTSVGIGEEQMVWVINGTVRGGGVGQRPSLQPVVSGANWSGRYQGGMMYQPDFGDPFLLLAIGGELWKVRVDTDGSVENLSVAFGGLVMPADEEQAYFRQAECFAVWQAGDLVTLPIFYDSGVTSVRAESMRRSNGYIGIADVNNEIPAATVMDYYGQRLWFARGREYGAGDIVFNKNSGHATWDFRDSVLHLFESPVTNAGDSFIVPTSAGNIRALAHGSNLDTALGQSQLFIFTQRAVYGCEAPIDRSAWTATTLDTMPFQKVVLNVGGAYGERSVVAVNGDVFFGAPPNGDIRSIQTSVRYFNQWAQVPLSRNVDRALLSNNRALLRFASGMQFENRLWETTLPLATPVGVAHQGMLSLDFDVISTLEERRPPAWEGIADLSGGPLVLQLLEGQFGGRPRAFAVVWSLKNQAIEVWEMRSDLRFDNGDSRITTVVETPAYTFDTPLDLKELETLELWFDRVYGTAELTVEYRPDAWPCWIPWQIFKVCAGRDCRELAVEPCLDNGYPQEAFCELDKATILLGKPPVRCIPNNRRPSNIAYMFSFRLRWHGALRLRGVIAHAWPRVRAPFEGITQTCGPTPKSPWDFTT